MANFNTRSATVCPLCGGMDLVRLPDPAPQSMTSDWRVTAVPLGKLSCRRCALVFRDPTLPAPADFTSGYELYAHAAGRPAEQTRQSAYAGWIASAVRTPDSVLDVGCGNGSLLLALRQRWPGAAFAGCDPSPESVRYATDAGLTAWVGTSDSVPINRRAALVVSVNVIEHTTDPAAFVASLRRALEPGGQLVLICPDGSRPSVELLIADHLYSFAATHLSSLLDAAGLALEHWLPAPAPLGAFQMAVATDSRRVPPTRVSAPLRHQQYAYLDAWRGLDAALIARLPSAVTCFGAGEAAGLLRAYAPESWSRVNACTTDDQSTGAFGPLPRVPITAVPDQTPILLAVRPQDQPAVAERLRARFAHVITWYDLIPSDGT